ncbi:hypothetical protein M378DRAFT_160924 [Amanita muscaria Koide BX008]|uniref:Uncharacterized protein n=1 Tax=Amanita muscaria (strain Koide BX008) TaxID=946122 RepID=A0A0C2SSY7_AMAMK|nr:hypothetical protein M378DRAFT_160924 [Amanita muscaria Koide BX008]
MTDVFFSRNQLKCSRYKKTQRSENHTSPPDVIIPDKRRTNRRSNYSGYCARSIGKTKRFPVETIT